MLIRDAELWRGRRTDVRLSAGRIGAIGALAPLPGEPILEARGGALLPGLHDHHMHVAAAAVARTSVRCGPPEVNTGDELAAALAAAPGQGWLRGIDYHESVAGMLNAAALDAMAPEHPVRIQHRSGRMWFLNTCALGLLLETAQAPPGLERSCGRYTGRLFEGDLWLRQTLRSAPPAFDAISAELARFGVTGITDMSPANSAASAEHFTSEQRRGALKQRCLMAGTLELAQAPGFAGSAAAHLCLGPAKLHLHEAQLPDFDASAEFVRLAHEQGRTVAIHCVTETELVFALALLDAAGCAVGNRIEHASVAPDHLIAQIAASGLWVATQPHFIAERGDQYLRDVEPNDRPFLYRLAAFLDAGVPLAGGSDAPFGGADPWDAMRAAAARQTREGAAIGIDQQLTPEQALSLYLADPYDFRRQRRVAVGEPADLLLLDVAWARARQRLSCEYVRATMVAGSVVYDRVDQAPGERDARADASAGERQQSRALASDPA
jgi:predicted amidohydrolase YtcJ